MTGHLVSLSFSIKQPKNVYFEESLPVGPWDGSLCLFLSYLPVAILAMPLRRFYPSHRQHTSSHHTTSNFLGLIRGKPWNKLILVKGVVALGDKDLNEVSFFWVVGTAPGGWS